MKANLRNKPPTFAAFIARVYDAYFPHDGDYLGDTDAEQTPLISGNDLPAETSHQNGPGGNQNSGTVPRIPA